MKGVAADVASVAANLTAAQREWLANSHALWNKAHEIVHARPDLDAGDVYHALRTLQLPPTERLRRGLTRVRVRSHSR